MSTLSLQFLLEIVFGTVVFLHITKKNFGAALAYSIQSLAMTVILVGSFIETGSITMLLVVLFSMVVKVILAPIFFIRLINKHQLMFSVSTYLNTSMTLIIIAVLTFLAHSHKFSPLTTIVPTHQALLSLALSAMFLSLFLVINRKGAMSQIVGILSFENSVLAFIVFAKLEQLPALQAGVIFNILVWIVIATVFVSMLYKHFGSLDITSIKHLKD